MWFYLSHIFLYSGKERGSGCKKGLIWTKEGIIVKNGGGIA
jgi:hypothetical protein